MNKPLISIIIPTFNRASLIAETLDSVLAQTYTNWECIIVDDGSTDNTAQIVENFIKTNNRFQYHKRPNTHKPGGNGARNYGFEISKGQYINWFDSDDIMHPNKLEEQILPFQKNNFDFIVSQTVYFKDTIDNIIKEWNKLESKNLFEDAIKWKVSWQTGALLFKRSYLEEQSHLFDPDLKAAQEWDFFCRIIYQKPNFFIIDKTFVYVREHQQRMCSDNSFVIEKEYNYYLARKKMENRLQIGDQKKLKEFFTTYYFYIFRLLILKKETHYSKIIFLENYKRLSIYKIFIVFIFSITFLLFNKGYYMLRKVIDLEKHY